MSRLRLSLTIPGAISLGAYEGGALAALIVAAKSLGEETLVIDSIAAASAGSITALLTARALLRGVDPVNLLAAAWVDNVSFKAMRTSSTASPLSSGALSEMATKVLGSGGTPEGPASTWQQQPVWLSMALASLAGLTYDLPELTQHTTVSASTFLDWYQVTLTNAVDSAGYLTHAQAAIASGSNAIGFPAKRLDRKADAAQYRAAGLQGFPDDGLFWYTDGGTVDNEPLGRTIDLAQQVGSDDDRLYLLIHPNAIPPTPSPTWAGSAPEPPWVRTAIHSVGIGRSQTIYEDLKRLEKTNSRLEWVDSVAPAVLAGIDSGIGDAGLSDAQAALVRDNLTAALTGAIDKVRESQVHVATAAKRTPAEHQPGPSDDWSALLDTLVHAASGLEGRDSVKVEVVSPAVDERIDPQTKPLAGSFFFHFGGFFDIKFRQSDFAHGYRDMRAWMTRDLGGYLAGVDISAALEEVDRRYVQLGWGDIDDDGATLSSLSFSEKLGLVRLAFHVGRVVIHDVLHGGV
jgi:predicted acylesterase/phospholipase RssA